MIEKLPKEFDIHEIEKKWQKWWMEQEIYRFDREDKERPTYCIDTPPPYPSGDFHMGNVLNWTYFDIVARYKRMKGYNVCFPQGWDCHGLPTEVRVEKEYGIDRTKVPPDEFRKLCVDFVKRYIKVMKEAIIRLGCSIDWSLEYETMDPDYWRRTQLSFVLLYEKGFIYRGTHPVNWCPRCETAIADAEVEHVSRVGTLHYIKFALKQGGHIPIATTRPELIPACVAVAVHPEDERYKKLVGAEVVVPIVNRTVRIIEDRDVDPKFGTGAVMICTYGDKADVKSVARHGLPVIQIIDKKGRMTERAGKYAGMTIMEARKAIVEDLKAMGILYKSEQIPQEVGVCWRCGTPVEILEEKQWFMKTMVLADEVERKAHEIKWYPEHMKWRLINWAKSLDWDWVISRQRIFATPIPVWYCERCGETIVAKPEWLPIDPRLEPPKLDKCPKCGHDKFVPDGDVLDTWFDSSITCAVHAGWPDNMDWRLFPADLHPSGSDIIRTWAYYLMVRHLALFGEKPYKACLINGMVLGTDGRMMSKSLGNYVAAQEVLDKYGADATRQWAAAGGATGSDIPFRWSDTEYGWRFLRKLWNAARFVSLQLQDYTPEKVPLQPIDRWLLAKLEDVTKRVTDALERNAFNIALDTLRNFTWHVFCDNYIEIVKHRLYQPDVYGEEGKKSAQYTLYTALFRIVQLLAPFCPHITEEIYQRMYAEEMGFKSIHVSRWPTPGPVDEEALASGDLAVAVISAIRREKASRRLPLNAVISRARVYAANEENAEKLRLFHQDICGTCKVDKLDILPTSGEGAEVEGYPEIHVEIEA
ncbi:valine--tRNA ligase [Candidatus Bathyarchaeota archaeon]|nr:MAG: valine--tRNA ligase [Candidatus Bathyarchaeota archaeon]